MSQAFQQITDSEIERLITKLDSLVEGERAAAMLIAIGQRAVPHLERFLLAGPPRTIALPRCRAAHALGELGAYSTLISYFRKYEAPPDAAVMFAEDAVRSAAARELLHSKSAEIFDVLLDAAKQRSTSGLIAAVAEFRSRQAVPLLFETLEDDLCREEAKRGLRQVPEAAHQYAILSIRGSTGLAIRGPFTLRRRRAALQLLEELGATSEEWQDLREFLLEQDADVVIDVAAIGFAVAQNGEFAEILEALFRVASHLNWVQEDRVLSLLSTHTEIARAVARAILEERKRLAQQPDWRSPFWRLLKHVLGEELEKEHHGVE